MARVIDEPLTRDVLVVQPPMAASRARVIRFVRGEEDIS